MAQSRRKDKEEDEVQESGPQPLVMSDVEIMLQSQIDELREEAGQLTIALTKLAELVEASGNELGHRVESIESIPLLAVHLRTVRASQ